jgi:hypothetical protein
MSSMPSSKLVGLRHFLARHNALQPNHGPGPPGALQQYFEYVYSKQRSREQFDLDLRRRSAKDAIINDLLRYYGPNSIFVFGRAGFGRGGFGHVLGSGVGGALKELAEYMAIKLPNSVFAADEFRLGREGGE